MINYALSLMLFISVIPSGEIIQKRFNSAIHRTSESFSSGDLKAAKMYAASAHELAVENGYDWGEAKSLFVLAFIHENTREYEKALPYYLESVGKYKDFDQTEAINDQAKIIFNIGNIMRENDKYALAITYYDQGIAFAEKHGLHGLILDNLHNKIIVCNESGMYDLARETINYKNSLISDGNLPEKLKTINETGLLFEAQGFTDRALSEFRSILSIEKDQPTSLFSGKALNNIGNILLKQGETSSARKAFLQALELAENEHRIQDIYQIRQSLAITEKNSGNFEKALFHAKEGIKFFDQVSKTRENIELQSLTGELYLETGNIRKGKFHHQLYSSEIANYFDIQEKLNSVGNQYKIDYITSTYFNEIEKRQTLYFFLLILSLLIGSFLLYLLYQHYKKIQIAKLIREQMNAVSFDLDDL